MSHHDKNQLTKFDSINMLSFEDNIKIITNDSIERFEQFSNQSERNSISLVEQIQSWDALTTDLVVKACYAVATKFDGEDPKKNVGWMGGMMPQEAMDVFKRLGLLESEHFHKYNTTLAHFISTESWNANENSWNSNVSKEFYELISLINKNSPYMGWKSTQASGYNDGRNKFWDFSQPHDEQSDFTLGGGSGKIDRSNIDNWAQFQTTVFKGNEFPIFMESVVPFDIYDEQTKAGVFWSGMTKDLDYQERKASDYFSLTGKGYIFVNPNKVPNNDPFWHQIVFAEKDKSFFDPTQNLLGAAVDIALVLGSRGRKLNDPKFLQKWANKLGTYGARLGTGYATFDATSRYFGTEQKTMRDAFDEKWGPFSPFGDFYRHGELREE